jgi:protein O-mannosyl-transferase
LLSKENTITFLGIAPLVLYFFRGYSLKNAIFNSALLWLPALLFLIIRTAVVGNNFGNQPMELMNNPFLKFVNGEYIPFTAGEKLATIFYTLWKYIFLLLIPISLTHDYYPRYVDIMHFTDPSVIISILFYISLIYFAIRGLKAKQLYSFGIFYFLITLSIVSNIVFPIGTNMSERFMFMPSLGFAICIGYLLQNIYENSPKILYFGISGVLLLLFSIKTFSRNLVWKNDFTLFTTDVKTSFNSAKVLNAAAGSLWTESMKENDPIKKQEMLTEALGYINKAIDVHPTYKNAYLIKGNILNNLKDYTNSFEAYEKALTFDNQFVDAKNNYAFTLREAGKLAGEKENNLPKAEKLLTKSDSLLPNDPETMRLLGVINGIKGNHAVALKYFEKVLAINPSNASANLNLGQAYKNTGNTILAEKYIQKALQLDPSLGKVK